ncbi:cobalt-precorrin 5A hydrolase [uncultured Megasphaera sp.]|uniref:cobalt-precorrin 5A hydrolase n=1 Tax=uncultured Megasphaera sp. TaxID=165188 RepID=UPI0026590BEB|nr:cobalamin biosynthesis protein [uncultured Megasphaera sp.]
MEGIIFSFTRAGTILARKLCQVLQQKQWHIDMAAPAAYCEGQDIRPLTPSLQDEVRQAFGQKQLLLFVGAAGIAVRSIAPCVVSKQTDPAVIVTDEKGRFVIPLLSGHIGGANGIARQLAAALGGQAVLTTATDVNGLFAVDEWAARHHLALSSLADAKAFAAAMLEEGTAGIYSDFPIAGPLPGGLCREEQGKTGLVVTVREKDRHFSRAVLAWPAVVYLGIGCRRGVSEEAIAHHVERALAEANLSVQAVAAIASVDRKAHEEGLLSFARQRNWPIRFFSACQLQALPGSFTASSFVAQTVGTDNVCERAAVLASGGTLILHKQGGSGVTVAAACAPYTVYFDT